MDGWVCKGTETRTTSTGKHVTQFTLNSPERIKEGGEWKSRPNFFRCQYWHHSDRDFRAEHINEGQHLFVSGEPRFEEWEDQNGNKRSIVKFNVDEVFKLAQKESETQSDSYQQNAIDDMSLYDEEIPF